MLNCIAETDCLFLNYKGNYILPFIHYCNNGNTFSNSKYPYLTGVSSLWDLACPNNKEIIDYSYSEFSKLTNNTINNHIINTIILYNYLIIKYLGQKLCSQKL